MSKTRHKLAAASAAALIAAAAVPAPPAKAEPAIGVTVVAPITPLTLGVAAAVVLVANEAFAKKPFGPNGEIMKIIAVPIKIVDGNVKASVRESGELAKMLRATVGISIRDIERYGLFGGPNSIFRKPLG